MTSRLSAAAQVEPRDFRRQRRVHLGVRRADGFIFPELFVDPACRWARVVGYALVLGLWLPLLAYHTLQLIVFRATRREYRRHGPYRHTIGPGPFVQSTLRRFLRPARPLCDTLAVLLSHADRYFINLEDLPPAIVIDDFLPDPEPVVRHAMTTTLVNYEKGWFTDAAELDRDRRQVLELVRKALEPRLGTELSPDAFAGDCDGRILGWNCAIHLKLRENFFGRDACSVHNHANLGRGVLAGVVYLNESPPKGSGTELLIRKKTGRCTEPELCYDGRFSHYLSLYYVPARFNRLVLFPAAALHRGDDGYGFDRTTGRLFMTLFFEMPN